MPQKPSHVHTLSCKSQSHTAGAELYDLALTRLKDGGFKLTKPRMALLKAVSSATRPFSTEEIFQASKKLLKSDKCDLVTVYRSLSRFQELGLVSQIDLGDGVSRYEMNDPSGHHHHHFVCSRCGKIEPLTLCELETQEQALKQAGYTGLSHRLEFFGVCPPCTKKR
jgi:Fur family ferric uptake transcriptional regulator